jgi:uncharacterized pyridoxal phosphate-containing UPF0001 family protein
MPITRRRLLLSLAAPNILRAGAATANISPALGSSLAGGMTDRKCTDVHDDLLIRCAALESGRAPELLIQVDLAGERTKFGIQPPDVPRLFEAAAACRAAQLTGLMTLPPAPEIPEDALPWFRRLRELRDGWASSGVPASMLRELSMGMSGDFEVAVEEGATLIRVGTAIFGERHVED